MTLTDVRVLDSITQLDDDGGGVVVAITGSHGARLAGERESYIHGAVAAAAFNDAGGGKDDAGTSRLFPPRRARRSSRDGRSRQRAHR